MKMPKCPPDECEWPACDCPKEMWPGSDTPTVRPPRIIGTGAPHVPQRAPQIVRGLRTVRYDGDGEGIGVGAPAGGGVKVR